MLMHSRERIETLEKERKELFNQMVEVCRIMTAIRKKKAEEIGAEIQKNLRELEMAYACFEIKIEQKNQLGIDGWDDVESVSYTHLGQSFRVFPREKAFLP